MASNQWRTVLTDVGVLAPLPPQKKGEEGPDIGQVVRVMRGKNDPVQHRMEKYTIPELTCDTDWLHITGQERAPLKQPFQPIKPKQILLVDIYSSWSGPCAAMEGHLRRLRHQFVATPDCLALAKACSDDITELEPFKSDPRPTFLIWARGGPVALMRGANRPLLTKLVEQEVEVEVSDGPRDPNVEIDFRSHKVIQCQGELALLGDDEVVHSIGSGRTDMLTSFFQDPPSKVKKKKKKSKDPKEGEEEQAEVDNVDEEDAEEDEEDDDEGAEVFETATEGEEAKDGTEEKTNNVKKKKERKKSKGKKKSTSSDKPKSDVEEEDGQIADEDTKADQQENGDVNEEGELQLQESGENGKADGAKKSKKMETGLLKEILDAKPKKRYGI